MPAFGADGLRRLLQNAEHAQRLGAIGQRLAPGGDAVEEVREFLAQRFRLLDRR